MEGDSLQTFTSQNRQTLEMSRSCHRDITILTTIRMYDEMYDTIACRRCPDCYVTMA